MPKIFSDWLALIERHLLHLRRIRQRLVALTLLPTVFTFVFGVLFGSVISVPGGSYQEFVMAGICGGYTTFSSFSLQTLNLMRDGEWLLAGLNVLLSVALCMIAVWLGHYAGTQLNALRGA